MKMQISCPVLKYFSV